MKNALLRYVTLFLFLFGIFGISYVHGIGNTKTIHWRILRGLNYSTGKVSAGLKALNYKTVRLPGYVVPLDGDERRVTSFLLVPTLGACIHVPPPPPNQIVYVDMQKGMPADYAFQPVWITGQFLIESKREAVPGTDFVPESSFKIVAIKAALYEM